MSDRESGAIEILCKEIGYPFDKRLERVEVLVAFVLVLVEHIGDMARTQASLAGIAASVVAPSEECLTVHSRVLATLEFRTRARLIEEAAKIHDFIHTFFDDEGVSGRTDHLTDMLSSCVSAIRFGLETPCQSRHAASAANHVFDQLYDLRLEDKLSREWQKEWSRIQLAEVVLRIASKNMEQI